MESPCIVTYDLTVRPKSSTQHYSGLATFREWRAPDENGDPGALVRSETLSAVIWNIRGGPKMDITPNIWDYRVINESLRGPLAWEERDRD